MKVEEIHATARKFLDAQGKVIINPRTESKLLESHGVVISLRDYAGRPSIIPRYDSASPPQIREINYEDLKKMNLYIASVRIYSDDRWFKGQKVRHILVHRDLPRGNVFTVQPPPEIKVQLDTAHQRVRLIGKTIAPDYVGQWKKI